MIVNNGDSSLKGTKWAQGMKVKARLESFAPSLYSPEPWRESRVDGLVTSKRYTKNLKVVTDVVKPTAEWKLHLKYDSPGSM